MQALADEQRRPNRGPVAVRSDDRLNALIVSGEADQIETVENLISVLDVLQPEGEQRLVKLYRIEHADLDLVAEITRELYGDPSRARRWWEAPDPTEVRIRIDEPNRTLVVSGTARQQEEIAALLAGIDADTAPAEQQIHVLPVQFVRADELADTLTRFLADRARATNAPAPTTTVLANRSANALVISATAADLLAITDLLGQLDQEPSGEQTIVRLYPLQYAQATDLRNTLQQIFRARVRNLQRRSGTTITEPQFTADDRTNTLLVTAPAASLDEIEALLAELDRKLADELHPLRIFELSAAEPQRAAQLLEQVVLGSDQQRRAATAIVPDNNAGVLLVRADPEVMTEIESVLAEIDRDSTRQFEVRTIVLERADAAAVADAIQRFYDDRASIATTGRGRRAQSRQVSVVGDRSSKTLLVAASDEDFAQIGELVKQFDSPQAAGTLTFRVFELEHAKARDLQSTVQSLVDDLTWNQGPSMWFRAQSGETKAADRVAVRSDDRLNALIVSGDGDKFDLVESLIAVLDVPQPADEQRIVKLYPVEHADLQLVADVTREVFSDTTRSQRWWEPPDPTEVKIRSEAKSNMLIVSATAGQHAEIAEFVAGIDTARDGTEQITQVIPVEYARAEELSETLRRFLADRAQATNAPLPSATILASRSANCLVVSANEDELATVRDLLGQLDQPDISGDRVIEIVVLQEGDAAEIARIVREQFSRRSGQAVTVTADVRTNSLIVNAPREEFAQAKALIDRLDAPSASDETIIRTYALEGARAADVVRILTETLQLDARGETTGITIRLDDAESEAVEVKAKIVADRRSNRLIVTATENSFPVIESLISKVDEVPAVSPLQWRIISLEHANAFDVYFTLNRFFRDREGNEPQAKIDYNKLENQLIVAATADQFEQIDRIIEQIDIPSPRQRLTEFVPLKFAEAVKVQEALSFFYGQFAPGAETPERGERADRRRPRHQLPGDLRRAG